MCSWKWTDIVLGIVILVFAWYMFGSTTSQWVITIAAIVLIVHALIPHAHSDRRMSGNMDMPARRKRL